MHCIDNSCHYPPIRIGKEDVVVTEGSMTLTFSWIRLDKRKHQECSGCRRWNLMTHQWRCRMSWIWKVRWIPRSGVLVAHFDSLGLRRCVFKSDQKPANFGFSRCDAHSCFRDGRKQGWVFVLRALSFSSNKSRVLFAICLFRFVSVFICFDFIFFFYRTSIFVCVDNSLCSWFFFVFSLSLSMFSHVVARFVSFSFQKMVSVLLFCFCVSSFSGFLFLEVSFSLFWFSFWNLNCILFAESAREEKRSTSPAPSNRDGNDSTAGGKQHPLPAIGRVLDEVAGGLPCEALGDPATVVWPIGRMCSGGVIVKRCFEVHVLRMSSSSVSLRRMLHRFVCCSLFVRKIFFSASFFYDVGCSTLWWCCTCLRRFLEWCSLIWSGAPFPFAFLVAVLPSSSVWVLSRLFLFWVVVFSTVLLVGGGAFLLSFFWSDAFAFGLELRFPSLLWVVLLCLLFLWRGETRAALDYVMALT